MQLKIYFFSHICHFSGALEAHVSGDDCMPQHRYRTLQSPQKALLDSTGLEGGWFPGPTSCGRWAPPCIFGVEGLGHEKEVSAPLPTAADLSCGSLGFLGSPGCQCRICRQVLSLSRGHGSLPGTTAPESFMFPAAGSFCLLSKHSNIWDVAGVSLLTQRQRLLFPVWGRFVAWVVCAAPWQPLLITLYAHSTETESRWVPSDTPTPRSDLVCATRGLSKVSCPASNLSYECWWSQWKRDEWLWTFHVPGSPGF